MLASCWQDCWWPLVESRAARRGAISGVVAETMGEALQIDSIDSDDPFSTAMKSWPEVPLSGGGDGRQHAHGGQLLGLFAGAHPLRRQGSVVSVGVLGHVFTIDKSSLKNSGSSLCGGDQAALGGKCQAESAREHHLPIGRMLDEAMGGLMDELAGELFGRQGHQDEPAQDDEDVMMDSI